MRTIGFFCTVFCAWCGLALALQNPDMQQKVAAAKEAAARNKQALHQYSWTSTTTISVKGEVKNTKIESNQYGPDGKVQKTELSEPPEQEQQQPSRGRRRRGLVKKAVVAHKSGEMQEEMQSAAALARSYVPPDPEKIQAVMTAGGVSISPSPDSQAVIRLQNYEKEGDVLTLTLDTASSSLRELSIETWLEEPDERVTLNVEFQSLSDGTSYAATTVLAIPDDEIEVRIENSNYQKLSQRE